MSRSGYRAEGDALRTRGANAVLVPATELAVLRERLAGADGRAWRLANELFVGAADEFPSLCDDCAYQLRALTTTHPRETK